MCVHILPAAAARRIAVALHGHYTISYRGRRVVSTGRHQSVELLFVHLR